MRCALQEEDLRDAILLVMANKQDMKGALNAGGCSQFHLSVVVTRFSITRRRCAEPEQPASAQLAVPPH